MNINTLDAEKNNRLSLLKAAGIDVDGFGLLNTFFLYDQIISYFDWISITLSKYGFHKSAIYLSNVKVNQFKVKGFEIRQEIRIEGCSGTYIQDTYIHDQDPDDAQDYICTRYNLTKSHENS